MAGECEIFYLPSMLRVVLLRRYIVVLCAAAPRRAWFCLLAFRPSSFADGYAGI